MKTAIEPSVRVPAPEVLEAVFIEHVEDMRSDFSRLEKKLPKSVAALTEEDIPDVLKYLALKDSLIVLAESIEGWEKEMQSRKASNSSEDDT